MPLLSRSMLLTTSAAEAAAAAAVMQQEPLLRPPPVSTANPNPPAIAAAKPARQSISNWFLSLMYSLCNAWSMFGAVPILACYTATMPIKNQTTRSRDSFAFLGVAIALTVVRILYSLLVLPRSHSLPTVHAAVQVLCAATLFLLFCQDAPSSNIGTKKTKTNGTSYSVMETFAEHAYTLPLLGACRLASASFRMDTSACGASSASRSAIPSLSNNTRTLLVWVDLVLGTASLILWVVMLCTLPPTDANLQLPVLRTEGHAWLQWLLFLLLAFTHLAQDSFTSLGRAGDAVVRGCVLIGELMPLLS